MGRPLEIYQVAGLREMSDDEMRRHIDDLNLQLFEISKRIGVSSSIDNITNVTNIYNSAVESPENVLRSRVVYTDYQVGSENTRELFGGMIYAEGDLTISLSSIIQGLDFAVCAIGSFTIRFEVGTANYINLDGTWLTQGQAIVGNGSTGDIIVCRYYSADRVAVISGGVDGSKWSGV
jgi:hypothetical protein